MAIGDASATGDPVAADAGNLALYRKYRSATFAEVIGQDHVTVPLRHALAAGRINHAYLFSGPRGCGKTSSARILARSLNCAQGPTPDPCGVCDSCRELAPNGPGSIDVIEIDAASHGGVDDARDLRERAFFAPVRDRYKVYIVDEAHMVSNQGFNALLKLVEEPPGFLVFVFATTEPDKVLTTIRSRTHHYPFRLIAPGAMRAHLESVCAAEGMVVEPAVLPLVVRAGGGSARDSLSILDQLLAGAGPDGVTYANAVALLGVTDGALLDDMVDALAAGDAAAVYGTVDRVVEAGHDPRRFSIDLLDRFRDLILLDAVPDAGERGLIDVPQDQLAHMADQAVRIRGATLTRYAEIVHTALIEMRGTTAPRLVLELLCARMMLPDASVDAAAVLQRLERLERRISAAGDAPKAAGEAPRPPATVQPAEQPPAVQIAAAQPTATVRPKATERPAIETPAELPPAATAEPAAASPALAREPGALDAVALRSLWPEVLNVIESGSKTIRALLEKSQVIEASGNIVTLAVAASLANRLAEERNVAAISEGLAKVVGGSWQIVVTAGAATQAPAGPDSGVAAPTRGPSDSASEFDPRDDADYEPAAPTTASPADPEAEAMKLLHEQLGARPLDG